MNIKRHEFDRVLDKFGFVTRQSGDKLAFLIIDGKTVVKTKRSHGTGELWTDAIRGGFFIN